MLARLLLTIFIVSLSFGDIFRNSSSLIFTLPTSKWQFEFDVSRYGVNAAGFLKDQRWTNSPVIIYCEIIPTNYEFELYTQLQKLYKTSQINEAKHQPSRITLNSPVPYEITFWFIKDLVYEYVAYFSLNDNYIASIVMSAKKNDVLMNHLDDYRTILRNFAKIAGGFN
jgi:hypothetical protein